MDSIKDTADQKYITVSELNWYVKQKFDRDPYLRQVFLQGEISNFRYRRNGHQYFSIKDDHAKINVVMFRGDFDKVQFMPEEGMKVYISGRLSSYEAQGSYQLYAKTMEPAGLGALYERLRQLQEKLAKEGLFNQDHKRPLPRFPDKIAVVTSPSGAVIHDIMVTANRRFPHAEIDLYPAQVQGEGAAPSLVAAMQQIAARGSEYDVMIIGRGGGSLEDLWAFNEEAVVRQVYQMPMPVISSVGHETDTTLCDLVADCRAATPTAAAEMATPDRGEIFAWVNQEQARLLNLINGAIRDRKQALNRLENSYIMREPQRLYEQKAMQADQASQALVKQMELLLNNRRQRLELTGQKLYNQSPALKIKQLEQTNNFLAKNLRQQMDRLLEQKKAVFGGLVQQLNDFSPLKTLSRGYSYTTDEEGTVLTSVSQLQTGGKIKLHLADGIASAVITEVKEKDHGREE